MQARQTTRLAYSRRPSLAAICASSMSVGLLMSACGGGGGGGAAPAAADTTPPTAQASAPLNSASQVATQTSISVTFSEAMDAVTLSAATFTLSAAGAAVPGSVSTSGSTATFTPAAALAAGTLYTANVSIAARDLAGNALAAAHTWSFTTVVGGTAKAWSPPVLLESGDATARLPAIAATSDDVPSGAVQATAVWLQDGSVYANRYQGGVWLGAVLIENETTEATGPRVAMGAMGRAVMTWTFGFNGVYSVWSNVYDPIPAGGAQFLPFARENARQISGGGNASGPQVRFDGSGFDAFNVWTEYVADRQPAAYHPAQRRYLFVPCETLPCAWDAANFGWRSAGLLEVGGRDASDPQVAAFGSGNAVAAWRKYQAGVWASTHTSAGGWAAAVQVTPGSTSTADKVAVAAAADGSAAIALWIDHSTARATLHASRLSGTAWSGPVAIDNAASGSSDDPQVVIDALGNAMIVWQQGGDIYARRCPAGELSGCGAPTLIESSTNAARFPRLAGALNGDAVVAWREATASGESPRIYANHYVAANAVWGASAAFIGEAAVFNEGPEVAMDKRGKATVVWAKDEAGKTNIVASRFE